MTTVHAGVSKGISILHKYLLVYVILYPSWETAGEQCTVVIFLSMPLLTLSFFLLVLVLLPSLWV